VGYNSVGDNRGSIFILLAVVVSQICAIPRNFEIRTYSRSGLSKVIDVGVNCQSKAHMRLPISHY